MNTSSKTLWIAVTLLVMIVGIIYLVLRSEPSSEADSSNTINDPEALFEQVSTQLGITLDQITYFRIFGTDRVQYSTGVGVTFAYKQDGIWRLTGTTNNQEIQECSQLAAVPENYRPACYDSGADENRYINEQGHQMHYPPSEMVIYK